MKKRIISLDIARSLAIFGMIIVNFKVALGAVGTSSLSFLPTILEGKAAALFVVLAGVGIGFNYKSATTKQLQPPHGKIIKRALFLFVIGLSYMPIWPADILHFYGIYMLVIVLVSRLSVRLIFPIALLLTVAYPVLLMFFDYEKGWDFVTLEYPGFWTLEGFFRNLFFNGFHPVLPWVSFMLVGFWLGLKDLTDMRFIRKIAIWNTTIFIFSNMLSYLGMDAFTQDADLAMLLSTSPMPPLPLYMISGASGAFMIIALLTLITSSQNKNYRFLQPLVYTGQLALTFYVAHVILGILPVYLYERAQIGNYSMSFSVTYALLFCLGCLVFAWAWRKRFQDGPLEWVMKKLLR